MGRMKVTRRETTRREATTEADAKAGRGRSRGETKTRAGDLHAVVGNHAAVQLLRGIDDPPLDRADTIARHGAAGSGGPLPFLSRISASFGRHDVSHVRAFTGPTATAAARALSARAYTRGASVVFGRTPDLRTAAHEAAHVVQQRAGVQLKGEVGEASDAHERHADAVAERVVTGRSAEELLDRYASHSRPTGGRPVIQRWGEPDHYAMGQRAGVKAVRALDDVETDKERTYKLGELEEDLTESRDFAGDLVTPTKVRRVEVDSSSKFMLRGPEGNPMSLGAANRFAGDFTKKPLESEKAHASPSLDTMPKTISKTLVEDRKKHRHHEATYGDFDADRRVRIHKEYLGVGTFAEYTLLGTNANHFYPLSTIEYRRQHARALQKVWVARRLWRQGQALEASDIETERLDGEATKRRANEVFRQAVMIEGYAGHFLADCFAAGHLAPHALGRIGDKSPVTAGARVNTWHDLFNALPDGIPTTLGTFHGDYSMDGNDLEYVSSVIAESLLEVMMPWYAGAPYDGNVVTPAPDVAAIREDPVAGPLWRTMCGDYEDFFESLKKSSGRRETKISLSKYIIYATSAGSGISKDELMPLIAKHVFGGDEGLERTETELDGSGIRGKIRTIIKALHQVLTWKSGIQVSTRLGQDFLPAYRKGPLKEKYLMSLRSRKLAKFSPTTNPRKALIDELKHWIEAWKEELKARDDVPTDELALLDKVLVLRDLDDSVKDKSRELWVERLGEILGDFGDLAHDHSLTSPLSPPREFVPQGRGVGSHDESSSGIAVRPKDALTELPDLNLDLVTELQYGLHALISNPRPRLDGDHDELYDTVIGATEELATHLRAIYDAGSRDGAPHMNTYIAYCSMRGFVQTLRRLKQAGKSLMKTRKETFRRDAIKSVRANLSIYFTVDAELLMLTTGRKVS